MDTTSIKVLLVAVLTALALAAELGPNYSYDDFMEDYHRAYEGQERAAHEAAFNKNYANLLRLKEEGHDVILN